LTIAEADFRPQIEIDVNPAIRRLALKSPPPSPLVNGEGPLDFGPDRLLGRNYGMRFRLCGEEGRIAADSSGKPDGGNGYDLLAHDRSFSCCWPRRKRLVLAPETDIIAAVPMAAK
jgi:hypothetical protein